VTEADLRKRLLDEELPREREAELRSWALVRADFKRRERVPWPRRRMRPLLALAAVVALLAAAFTPPGRGLAERLRDAITPAPAEPLTLPAPGRLLVLTGKGPWIVQKDGSKRLLGAYEDAVWSPRGLFIGATRGHTLVALEPNGRVRWTLSRPDAVGQPRWAPSGFRIAYRSGRSIRIVAGDGTGDRLLARTAGEAVPAWKPGSVHVLAFADARNRVRIESTDEGRAVLTRKVLAAPLQDLVWSPDGNFLLALTTGNEHALYDAAGKQVGTIEQPRGQRMGAAAFAPGGGTIAYVTYDPANGVSSAALRDPRGKTQALFTGAGRLDGIAWSPDGRWLLVAWPDADQWLFLRAPDVRRVVTVSGVSAEFDPGGSGGGSFPRVVSWCC
jgi:WD40 repeat protein